MYDSTNKKIYKPVSIYDVQQALSVGLNDVKSLCLSPLINKWAKYKPVYNAGYGQLTEAQFKTQSSVPPGNQTTHYGLYFGMQNVLSADLHNVTYEYLGYPQGGTPYRLQDFAAGSDGNSSYGYKHDAVATLAGSDGLPSPTTADRWVLQCTVNYTNPASNPMGVDILEFQATLHVISDLYCCALVTLSGKSYWRPMYKGLAGSTISDNIQPMGGNRASFYMDLWNYTTFTPAGSYQVTYFLMYLSTADIGTYGGQWNQLNGQVSQNAQPLPIPGLTGMTKAIQTPYATLTFTAGLIALDTSSCIVRLYARPSREVAAADQGNYTVAFTLYDGGGGSYYATDNLFFWGSGSSQSANVETTIHVILSSGTYRVAGSFYYNGQPAGTFDENISAQ